MILIGIQDNKVELTYKKDGPPITDIRRIEIEQTCGEVSLRLEFDASYNVETIKRQLQDLKELCGETSCVVTAIGETASIVLDNTPALDKSPEPQPLSEREQQRRSFAYGNTHLDNERITPAVIDRAADKLEQTEARHITLREPLRFRCSRCNNVHVQNKESFYDRENTFAFFSGECDALVNETIWSISGQLRDIKAKVFSNDRKAKELVLLFQEPLVFPPYERTPDGHINNCALANGESEKDCQICNGVCPDRDRPKEDVAPQPKERVHYLTPDCTIVTFIGESDALIGESVWPTEGTFAGMEARVIANNRQAKTVTLIFQGSPSHPCDPFISGSLSKTPVLYKPSK